MIKKCNATKCPKCERVKRFGKFEELTRHEMETLQMKYLKIYYAETELLTEPMKNATALISECLETAVQHQDFTGGQ